MTNLRVLIFLFISLGVIISPALADMIHEYVSPPDAFSTGTSSQPSQGSSSNGEIYRETPAPSLETFENETIKINLVSEVELKNNLKLQEVLEKVIGEDKINEQSIENMIELSESISSDLETTRNLRIEGEKSILSLSIKYKGTQKINNFVVYDKIPKDFAESTDKITVNAPKSIVKVVEKDPSYVFIYKEVAPNEELSISYLVNLEVDPLVINNTKVEVYAMSLGEEKEEIQKESKSLLISSLENIKGKLGDATGNTGIILIIIVLVVAVIYLKKGKREDEYTKDFAPPTYK